MKQSVILGDITKLQVDAIVNAANETLLGGGGVDGAIHRAAGPELLEECRQLHGCKAGEAKITKGYRLPAKYVIHTVGPVFKNGLHGEADLLASCYRRCVKLAYENHLNSIAFPCISTGVYGYPKKEAYEIAVASVKDAVCELGISETLEVIFVCFDRESFELYQNRLQ